MSLPLTEQLRATMIRWRHDFHRHPELGFEEQNTSKVVFDSLSGAGIEAYNGIGGTGVVGVLRRGAGEKKIGLRADMDALAILEQNTFDHRSQHEGKMHACGHDGHMSMLLGAAHHLAKYGNFNGTVYFIFQPAEEHGRGAQAMMNDGLFERFPAQSVYAIHNMPTLPVGQISLRPGPIMACEDNFEIIVKGVGSHAAFPHMGKDPIIIASQIVMALQTIVARTVNPIDNAVVSVTEIKTNGTRNVIPGEVVLTGDTRSFLPEMQDHIEEKMRSIVSGICQAHGADYEFSYSREFASTINTPTETQIAAKVAKDLLGEENVNDQCEPVMGSEDFGYMLQTKPGCYLFLGNGGDGPTVCSLHNNGYDFNDDILTLGADFWVRLVESELPA